MKAFEKGERFAEPFANVHTIASGLRVPAAVGDFMMLDAIRASGGTAIAGREDTGAAQKYPETVTLNLPRLDKNGPVDYAALGRMS